jgi:hypothetical protein
MMLKEVEEPMCWHFSANALIFYQLDRSGLVRIDTETGPRTSLLGVVFALEKKKLYLA